MRVGKKEKHKGRRKKSHQQSEMERGGEGGGRAVERKSIKTVCICSSGVTLPMVEEMGATPKRNLNHKRDTNTETQINKQTKEPKGKGV